MSDKVYILGIDVGTTGTKSILFTGSGVLVSSAYKAYATYNDAPLHSEQKAQDWWDALVYTVRLCIDGLDDAQRKKVLAMCLSTQGGTMVPVDKNGKPTHRAFVWSDDRCIDEREQMLKTCSAEHVYSKTGWLLGNGFNALEALWMKNNDKDAFERTAYFMSVPDYLSYCLTGKMAIDVSNAGINQFHDVVRKKCDESILSAVGVKEEQLSYLVDSGDVIGKLTKESADVLGLSEDTLLVAGAHDQYCVALGSSLIHDGDSLIGTGTAWVVTGIRSRPQTDISKAIAFSRHSVKDMWGQLLSLSSGGASLKWIRNRLGLFGASLPSYEEMDTECSKRGVKGPDILFYPYMSSCRYPVTKQRKNCSFIGVDPSHDWYDLCASVMEGVAYQTVWMLEEITGNKSPVIKVTGGATNSRYWMQMIADITGREVSMPMVSDIGCVGAAMLAGRAAGIFKGYEEAVSVLAPKCTSIMPDEKSEAYQKGYKGYKEMFDRIYERV